MHGSIADYRQHLVDQEQAKRETERTIAEAKLAQRGREARESRLERTMNREDS